MLFHQYEHRLIIYYSQVYSVCYCRCNIGMLRICSMCPQNMHTCKQTCPSPHARIEWLAWLLKQLYKLSHSGVHINVHVYTCMLVTNWIVYKNTHVYICALYVAQTNTQAGLLTYNVAHSNSLHFYIPCPNCPPGVAKASP